MLLALQRCQNIVGRASLSGFGATHGQGSSAERTALSHTEPGGVAAGLATDAGSGPAVARISAWAGGAAGAGAAAGAAMASTAAGAAGARVTAGARATLAAASGWGLVAGAAGICTAGPANASCRPAGAGRSSTARGSSGGSSLATAAAGAAAAAGTLLAGVASSALAPAGGTGASLASSTPGSLRRRTGVFYMCVLARPAVTLAPGRPLKVCMLTSSHIHYCILTSHESHGCETPTASEHPSAQTPHCSTVGLGNVCSLRCAPVVMALQLPLDSANGPQHQRGRQQHGAAGVKVGRGRGAHQRGRVCGQGLQCDQG